MTILHPGLSLPPLSAYYVVPGRDEAPLVRPSLAVIYMKLTGSRVVYLMGSSTTDGSWAGEGSADVHGVSSLVYTKAPQTLKWKDFASN